MPHPLTTTTIAAAESSGSAVTSAASSPCEDGENICDWVFEQTSNSGLADAADWVVGKPSALVGLILIGLVVRWVLHRLIDRVIKRAEVGMLPNRVSRAITGGKMGAALNLREDPAYTRRVQRAATMGTLLKSIVTGVVITVVALMFIAELGYDIAPLIASAGIIGVAIGFGSQALVKDFLSGIFMIFEDQYGVGDEVDLGEASGTVEAVSLRVTRLRDVNGTVWYVRNGEILRVGNMSQNWARTVLDVRVAYGEDLARVQRVLADIAHDLWEDEDFRGRVIEEPSVWGVQELAPDSVVVRVALKTAPLEQWAVAREMRQRIKARFDLEGFEVPFAQQVVWMRDDERPDRQRSAEDQQPAASGPAQAEGDL
ncbi:mechanosensitive ion channel family protein [Nocardioides okcheonensis]|uniref:mechanosensitive ion channel family protein n=1 Tax=Nocardioides okcheonensis TaxID=2894081 RepID=UPI001E53856B|nr:mechanosensitive ion channel family protein [Nocardioides okcheonensis]UFN45954.1 mechanosensitive ion channel family protein [Nocardioides okcheonensis]